MHFFIFRRFCMVRSTLCLIMNNNSLFTKNMLDFLIIDNNLSKFVNTGQTDKYCQTDYLWVQYIIFQNFLYIPDRFPYPYSMSYFVCSFFSILVPGCKPKEPIGSLLCVHVSIIVLFSKNDQLPGIPPPMNLNPRPRIFHSSPHHMADFNKMAIPFH